jgi:hypothetical protein
MTSAARPDWFLIAMCLRGGLAQLFSVSMRCPTAIFTLTRRVAWTVGAQPA